MANLDYESEFYRRGWQAGYEEAMREVRQSPSVTSSQEKTASGSAAPRKPRKAGERSR